jgi:hypothetical protein
MALAKARVDAELGAMLESGSDSLEAVFRLRPAEGEVLIPPEQTERVSRALVDRAERASGEKALDMNVFRNLGSFVVSASRPLIRALLQQPEVEAAIANRHDVPALVAPVDKRPASLPGASHARIARTAVRRTPSRRTALRGRSR